MKLLRDSWSFFIQEKQWIGIFILVVLLYLGMVYWEKRRPEELPSPVLENLRLVETKLKEEIRSSGGMQKFLIERPKLFLIFNLFTLLLMGGMIIGLILDFIWFFRPSWRSQLSFLRPPPTPRWGISTIFKIILLFFLAGFCLSIFLSLIQFLFFRRMSANLLVLIHTTISDILCVGLILYFIYRLGGHWKDLGFWGVDIWKDLKVGLIGYLAVFPPFFLVLVTLVALAHFFVYEPPPHPLIEIFLEEEKEAPQVVVYSVILACVIGPFLEEIFFRGFCYPAFKKRWGVGWGLVLSAAFFGLIHQNAFAFLPIFVLGLSLAYLYEKRGTLLPSIVLHVVHNSIFVAYFFLAKEVLKAV